MQNAYDFYFACSKALKCFSQVLLHLQKKRLHVTAVRRYATKTRLHMTAVRRYTLL